MANAGIDQSNLGAEDHGRRVLLLPQAPDDSARRLKERLDAHFRADIGCHRLRQRRAERGGSAPVGLAIGAAGVPALWDRRGEKDLSGRPAGGDRGRLCRCGGRCRRAGHGRSRRGPPAALVRGLDWSAPDGQRPR
jgi:coenzyme F420-0:L-glutamate ligase/coenzyme F420-1:gamma-L-glutamate ligase